ncbi:hypothetical protein CTAYLR_007634 [Chrysophaeum taylorii]|uniref:VTT domain-containing protein n=1 Tax=Chrysophaeum taylorii TaxID=2483200 RepID=A0AAD7XJI8_9STRA|nr:hypothetical protein CTAYLR_007634 [Chrysophaeum taylorii]
MGLKLLLLLPATAFVTVTTTTRTRRRPPPRVLAAVEPRTQKIWEGRRNATRSLFALKLSLAAPADDEDEFEEDDPVDTIATATFGIVILAIVLRVGGRAALLGLVGLDPSTSEGIASGVQGVLETMSSTTLVASYAFLWVVAKTLCLDPLGLALAIASGVLFGGVVRGTLAACVCASLGSSVAFYLARLSDYRPRILTIARRNKRARALVRGVSDRGFATVLVLRLAPVLPIPIGAYSYLYGAAQVPFWKFFPATFLGSIKPYAFDAYLGCVGNDIIQAKEDVSDFAILVVCAAVVAVGAVASQLATQIWNEIEAAAAAQADDDLLEDDDGGDWIDVLQLRDTWFWRAGASVSRAAKQVEPEPSRRLRKRARRARYALASMAQQELHLAHLELARQDDPLRNITYITDLPPGADASFSLSGWLLEASLYSWVVVGALFNNQTLQETIDAKY